MEHGWVCSNDDVEMKHCRMTVMALAGVLLALLTLVVASFSYGAEVLTLEQAVSLALQNNLGVKAADAQVETEDADLYGVR